MMMGQHLRRGRGDGEGSGREGVGWGVVMERQGVVNRAGS